MSRAVFAKTMRDALLLIVLVTLGIIVFESVMVRILMETAKDLELLKAWLDRPLIKSLVRLALGADLTADLSLTSLATFGMIHPLLFALSWTLLLTMCSGALSGEMGRGTADVLLALPVSRGCVYVSTSLAWLLATVLISTVPILGYRLGEWIFSPAETFDYGRLILVEINLFALHLAMCALATLMSTLSARRGIAVGIVLGIALASDLVSLLVAFWEAASPLRFFGFLEYYGPLAIVRTGELPWGDIAILVGLAVLAWVAGLVHFSRRDIPAA